MSFAITSVLKNLKERERERAREYVCLCVCLRVNGNLVSEVINVSSWTKLFWRSCTSDFLWATLMRKNNVKVNFIWQAPISLLDLGSWKNYAGMKSLALSNMHKHAQDYWRWH